MTIAFVGDLFNKKRDPYAYEKDDRWVLPKVRIGLEWEIESATMLVDALRNVSRGNGLIEVHADGSLRDGGAEFVTTGSGLFGKDLTMAISLMAKSIEEVWKAFDRRYWPVTNYRTGFHVHIDVRDLSPKSLVNIFLIYTLAEIPIFNFIGRHRYDNNFCVPWHRSELDENMAQDISRTEANVSNNLITKIKNMPRYSAMNIASLAKYGTLEFRHMENNLSEISTKQIDFINLVMSIRKYAEGLSERFADNLQAFHFLKSLTPRQFLEEVSPRVNLPTENWDYGESLLLATKLLDFPATMNDFLDVYFSAFRGTSPYFT